MELFKRFFITLVFINHVFLNMQELVGLKDRFYWTQ